MKRRSVIALLLCLFTLLSLGCAGKSAYDTAASEPMAASPGGNGSYAYSMTGEEAEQKRDTSGAPGEADGTPEQNLRKIIYNAGMSVTADAPDAALASLTAQAAALGGYVASSYTNTDELGAYRCTASLRVPADKLDALVSAAEGTGKVDSYQLTSDDISLSYYDIAARLNNAKAEEKQLIAILEDCETVEEVLEVRKSLTAVRSDIESYQGQINYWDNLVSFATLDITIHRTARAAVEKSDDLIAIWKASDVWKSMSTGFRNSARFVVNALGAIGIFLAYAVLPAAAVCAIVYLIVRLVRRRRKGRPSRLERRAARKARRNAPAETVRKDE